MKKRVFGLGFILAALALLAASSPASADVMITYNLDSITFADGGTATGTLTETFVQTGPDAYTAYLTDYNVTITDSGFAIQPLAFTPATGAGSEYNGTSLGYQYILMYTGNGSDNSSLLYLNIPLGTFVAGTPLPSGSIPLVLGSDAGGQSGPATAVLVWQGTEDPHQLGMIVSGTGGSLDPQQSAVPEPCTMLLLGPGMVGLIGIKRKYLG